MSELPTAQCERWAPVPGYEGRYEVSDHGRVRSWVRSSPRLIGGRTSSGPKCYAAVHLKDGLGGSRLRPVHQLVLEAFVGPRPPGAEEARHLNGNHRDNRLGNLAWGSRAENAADAIAHGVTQRGAERRARITPEDVRNIRAAVAVGEPHSSIAKRMRLSRSMVSMIAERRRWAWLA